MKFSILRIQVQFEEMKVFDFMQPESLFKFQQADQFYKFKISRTRVAERENTDTAQKMKFFIKDFFNKCVNVTKYAANCKFGHIYSTNP